MRNALYSLFEVTLVLYLKRYVRNEIYVAVARVEKFDERYTRDIF